MDELQKTFARISAKLNEPGVREKMAERSREHDEMEKRCAESAKLSRELEAKAEIYHRRVDFDEAFLDYAYIFEKVKHFILQENACAGCSATAIVEATTAIMNQKRE